MPCDLARLYGHAAASLPHDPRGDETAVLHAGRLAEPPAGVATGRLHIRKLHHTYDSFFRADALWISLSRETSRQLGLFLLACAFHGPKRETVIHLTHPESSIRHLCWPANAVALDDPPPGLTMVPHVLRYSPAHVAKHPWPHRDPARMPVFALSNREAWLGESEAEWRNRDTVWFIRPEDATLLGEFFLNIGSSLNGETEYALESDAGYRGVGPLSAEVQIFLPGSPGYWFPQPDET
jgi:hypothetical protein